MRNWTITDWPNRDARKMWTAWLLSGDDVLVKIEIESDVPQATAEAIVNEFARNKLPT